MVHVGQGKFKVLWAPSCQETLALVVKRNFTLRLYNSKANLLYPGLIGIIPMFRGEENGIKRLHDFLEVASKWVVKLIPEARNIGLEPFLLGSHGQHLAFPDLNVAKRLHV